MPDTDENKRPDNFANAPLDEAVGRFVRIIRAERPQVIITYRDEQNFYPHPDHIRVHEISGPRVRRGGRPRRVSRRRRPVAAVEALLRVLVDRAGQGAAPGVPRPRRGERVHVVVRARLRHRSQGRVHDAHRRRRLPRTSGAPSLLAHRTQVDPEGHWMRLPDDVIREVFPWEEFTLARSLVDNGVPEGEFEDDLFAGLRAGAVDRA